MTQNHIGLRVFFSDTLPATNDKAGFEALTWEEALGAISLPRTAFDTETITVEDVQRGFAQTLAGMDQGQGSQMSFRGIDADAGQAMVKAQARTPAKILCYKKVRGSGAGRPPAVVTGDPVEYAQGIVTAYTPNEENGQSYEGFVATFTPNDEEIIDVEPT